MHTIPHYTHYTHYTQYTLYTLYTYYTHYAHYIHYTTLYTLYTLYILHHLPFKLACPSSPPPLGIPFDFRRKDILRFLDGEPFRCEEAEVEVSVLLFGSCASPTALCVSTPTPTPTPTPPCLRRGFVLIRLMTGVLGLVMREIVSCVLPLCNPIPTAEPSVLMLRPSPLVPCATPLPIAVCAASRSRESSNSIAANHSFLSSQNSPSASVLVPAKGSYTPEAGYLRGLLYSGISSLSL